MSNYETKVFVNCESRPGSASVDQFDRLGDRNNTHVLFSESSLAQFGLEQLTTTHRDKKQKRCFCTRVEILIESAWTVPLWSWNEPTGSLLALFVVNTSQQAKLFCQTTGGVCFCEEPNVFDKLNIFWFRTLHSVSILGSEVKHRLIFELLRKYSF